MFETLLSILAFILSLIQTYIIILDRLDRQREKREQKKEAYLQSIEKASKNGAYTLPPRRNKP